MTDITTPPDHPAKFSADIMVKISQIVVAKSNMFDAPIRILDPMAGVGRIHKLHVPGYFHTTGLEIEPEWANQHGQTIEGDATEMPFDDNSFDIIATSPPYGNRMADQFVSKDGTKRMTYYHFLGRRLHENSAAGMHFGPQYQKTMREIFIECKRVLVPNGLIILNVSDFIKNGDVVDVVKWYKEMLIDLGYKVIRQDDIRTKRMRYGANHKLRVPSEAVITFQLRRF